MLDSRKSNPSCGSSEEIATYLYEEMTNEERSDFEIHLGECATCPDELATFSSISSSVQHWRDSEFAGLKTPEIRIPYENESDLVQPGGWLFNLRALISASPVFMKTAGAFASLVLIALFGWLVLSSLSNSDERAGSNEQTPEPVKNSSEIVLPKKPEVAVETGSDSKTTVPEESPEIVKETAPAKVKQPVKVAYRNRKTTGGASSKKRSAKNRSRSTKRNTKRISQPDPKPKVVEEPIRLTEEFAIDKSKDEVLTLSDLLDELGSDD